MVRWSVLASLALIVSFRAPARAGTAYFVVAQSRNDTVVAEPPAAPLPAALPTGAIGVVAVLVARWWPGAPWRGA